MLVPLQHSANPDLPGIEGHTALMNAAVGGTTACVKALLRAKANTELLSEKGLTALRAEIMGTRPSRELLRQHAARRRSLPPCACRPTAAGEPAASAPAAAP